MKALLEARGLVRTFAWKPLFGRRRLLWALDRIDLEVKTGECLAIVGESGSGKTTLGRTLLRLLEPDAGQLCFAGEDMLAWRPAELRRRRRDFQMVFQEAAGAFDPRQRVAAAIGEGLGIHGLCRGTKSRRDRVAELLATVDLPPALMDRFPHQLSGGQRQRVGIARALATEPSLLILDEPVSALDVSVQARILLLLFELRRRLGLAMVLITHDLAVVDHLADRIAVIYLGRVVEIGPRAAVLGHPRHPYTASLLASVPVADPSRRFRVAVVGDAPSPLDPPSGCPFHPRCPKARSLCRREAPALGEGGSVHRAACHFPDGTDAGDGDG